MGLVVQVAFFVKTFHVSPLYLWQEAKMIVLASAVMVLVVLVAMAGFYEYSSNKLSWLTLGLIILIGATTYFASMRFMDPPFVAGLRNTLARTLKT
jgi:hypothetical protein